MFWCRKISRKGETKTNNASVPLIQYRLRSVNWRQSGRNKSDYGGKDLWKRWVLSLEWKVEGVTDGENGGNDCDELICAGWGERGGKWTQWGWRKEEGSWFHRWGDAYLKERLVICNDEDTDGRAIGWQQMRSGFYLKTEQRSDCAGSQVGWLWELCT